MSGEKPCNHPPGIRWKKTPAVHFHVLAAHQGLNDAGVGRGPADAIVFKGFHQAGLGKTRWRLGKMLLRTDFRQVHHLTFSHVRQMGFLLFFAHGLSFLVSAQEPLESDY